MASITKNFFYSSILTTANYVFPLLTYPYISRVLGVTNVGICNFVDSIINYYSMFSLMGIVTVGIRNVAASREDKDKLSKTVSALFFLNTISTAIVVAVLIGSIFIVPKFYAHKELMFIGVLKVIFNYLMIDWFYRGIEDFKYITYRGMVVRVGYVLSVFLLIRDRNDYGIYYFLSVMMVVLNAIVNLWHSRTIVRFNFNLKQLHIRAYVSSFMTIGLYVILTSMYTTFNVSYLGFVCGETEVGYYTTATKLHAILLSLFSAFTGVMLPRMSLLVSQGNMDDFKKLISKSLRVLIVFSLPFVIFMEAFAAQVIYLIAGPGYELAIRPMLIVMPLLLVIGYEQIIVLQVLMPLKQDKAIFVGSCVGASVGVLGNVFLVPLLKSEGSAFVWLISELFVLVVAQYYTSRIVKYKFPIKQFAVSLLSAIPCFLLLLVIRQVVNDIYLMLGLGTACTLLYYYLVYVYILKDEIAMSLVSMLVTKIKPKK